MRISHLLALPSFLLEATSSHVLMRPHRLASMLPLPPSLPHQLETQGGQGGDWRWEESGRKRKGTSLEGDAL